MAAKHGLEGLRKTIALEGGDRGVMVSIGRASATSRDHAREAVYQAATTGLPVEGVVKAVNKGGLEVDLGVVVLRELVVDGLGRGRVAGVGPGHGQGDLRPGEVVALDTDGARFDGGAGCAVHLCQLRLPLQRVASTDSIGAVDAAGDGVELESRVADRTAELERSNHDLQETLQAFWRDVDTPALLAELQRRQAAVAQADSLIFLARFLAAWPALKPRGGAHPSTNNPSPFPCKKPTRVPPACWKPAGGGCN